MNKHLGDTQKVAIKRTGNVEQSQTGVKQELRAGHRRAPKV